MIANLERVRRDGYTIERGENEDDATCIAAPILDANGASVASVSVSLPPSRASDEQIDQMVKEIVSYCETIRTRL